jgi:hypothetical protein
MAERIDDVLAIDVDRVDDERPRIVVNAALGARLPAYQSDILHCLWTVNLLMMKNLNSDCAQVILRFAFAY